MKRFLHVSIAAQAMLFLVLVIGWQQVNAQAARIDFRNEPSAAEVKTNDFQRTKVDFKFQGVNAIDVKTERGTFSELFLDQGYSIGEPGTPKLPAYKHLIEIPFGAGVEVKVVKYTTTEYRLADFGIDNPLMPVQPSLRKDLDASQVPFEFKAESFTKNAFTENPLAEVEVLGVMRGMRIARLTVAPVQYNPAQGTIKVFNDIELEVRYSGADYSLTNHIKASTYSPYFDVVYGKVLNPFGLKNVFDNHPDLTKNPIKMVVVSNRMFEAALQPYLEWKTQQGFFLTVGYTDEIGTSATAIKNFIHAQYNAATPDNPAPTFIVMVGDPATMPASATGSSSQGVTDLYYASVDGDYFPEMYYGRLSARNVQELQNQLDKILYYEKYEFTDPSYLNNVTLIAGQDGSWNPAVGQPTVKYGTANYFNAAHGFNTVWGYGVTNDPNNPNNNSGYTGCYDNDRISVSLINFTAHCSPTSWAGPYLTVADVHNMTNTGKYPLAIGNCCQSSMFSQPESIGEAWVRAANKGGVAYIGSVPNTYWFEDFYWSVGAFPLSGNNGGYVPTVAQTTLGAYDAPFVSDYLAVAALKFVGNLAVTEVNVQGYPSHSSPLYYWQAYHTFGDPSTFIYLTEGEENQVSHMPIVPIGLDTYTVNALPGSYVAISMNGVLHGAAFVDATGEVEVPIEPILDGGEVRIVVTKHQYIPYIVDLPAAALEGPFIVLDNYEINDTDGNANQMVDYGEELSLHLTIKNVGADPVGQVSVTIFGQDPYITIVNADETITFEGMEAGDQGNTSTVEDAFLLTVAHNVPNQHKAAFQIHVTDGEDEWVSNLRLTANAPVFEIDPVFAIDDSQGDNNNRLDPGETALLNFSVTNKGHATANLPVINLEGTSPYLAITQDRFELSPIEPGQTVVVPFEVVAHASAMEGTFVEMAIEIEDGHWYGAETMVVIGQVPEMEVGTGTVQSVQYPFYNYYKANRTQMLYKASELGSGEKVITELGFNIIQLANNYGDLPNFKILIKPTTINTIPPGSFADMTGATEVFAAASYSMPAVLGWHMWDIQNFTYNGETNLIIEIIWGQLPNWTSTYYRVACTTYPENLVAYGYSDTANPPGYNGVSGSRPNLFLAFAAEQSADAQEVVFTATMGADLLENAAVKIGSLTKHTNTEGQTSFTLMPGTYAYTATSGIMEPISGTLLVEEDALEIELNFTPLYGVVFEIDDIWGNTVADAVISVEENNYEPGDYEMPPMQAGTYNFLISRDGYHDFTGSLEVVDENLVVQVTLTPDGTSITDLKDRLSLQVFPNPTRGPIHVRLNTAGKNAVVSLTNYQGQIISQETLSPGVGQTQLEFNLRGFASGVYYLKVVSDDQTRIEKIILQ